MKTRIILHDKVGVYWENQPPVFGEVLYIPQDTGDCWHIRDNVNGAIHYVQTFARMTVKLKGLGTIDD